MKGFGFVGIGGGGGSIGTKKIPVSKKEADEQRKKEDEQAAAVAFEEYVAVFQDTAASKPSNKVWIKAGTYDAGRRQEDTKEKGKLYKPTSRFETKDILPADPPIKESSRHFAGGQEDNRVDRPGGGGGGGAGKKKTQEKKKSNLEIFKDELKLIQEEREERHRLKKMLGLQEVIKLPPKPGDDLRASLSLELDDVRMGSIDDGDPNTTNIYLGNLPTKISEQQLMEIFGKFGPLASVKVMWPRTDEEKARNRLSGFVAFMSRRDGERALKHLAGKEILNAEVKLGWGKAVPIPPFPIYIPPTMMELTMPPPPSGLPFNAQPDKKDRHKIPPPGTPYPLDPKGKEEFERVLINSSVKVVIPTDRTLISLIHRVIEFVTREGPMFEAMIMNREISNLQYRFLFENQSPAHIYYRWKLYSILQGDSTQRWRTEDFRMFKGGSIWKPPTLNPFTQGMPDELIPEDEREIRKGTLSNAQRERMERMLRKITPERHKVAEVMIFSIEHAEAADEICLCIKESLSNPKTSLVKKVARLYVISDVLHNCTCKGMNAVSYRKGFKIHLPSIFQEIHYAYQTACTEGIGSTAESFKQRVMACFRAWDEWGIYPSEFLIRLQNIFLGLLTANSREEEEKIFEGVEPDDDEELMRKRRKSPPRAQQPPKSALNLVRALQSSSNNSAQEEDIDGIPLEEDIDGVPMNSNQEDSEIHSSLLAEFSKRHFEKPLAKGGFVPSKWETVDPEEVKAGAVTTTSKWDLFEDSGSNSGKEERNNGRLGVECGAPRVGTSGLVAYGEGEIEEDEEDIDGRPMDEDEDEQNSHSQHQNYYNNNNIAGSGGTGNYSQTQLSSSTPSLLQQYSLSQQQQQQSQSTAGYYDEDNSEERRLKLREVELKVLAFQDELESGRRSTKHGLGQQEMVNSYREKLLRRTERHKQQEKDYSEKDEDIFGGYIDEENEKHSRSNRRGGSSRGGGGDSQREPRSSRRHRNDRSRSASYEDRESRDNRESGSGGGGRRSPSTNTTRSSGKSRKQRSRSDSRSPDSRPSRHHYSRSSRSRSTEKSRKGLLKKSRSRSRSPNRRHKKHKR